MTREGWRHLVLDAVRQYQAGDATGLELLTDLLTEQDEAKQRLRAKGYGCTGMGWIETVNEVGYGLENR